VPTKTLAKKPAKKPVAKKSATTPAVKSPVAKKSATNKPTARKPDATKPVAPGFGPPDWGNVLPPPIELVSSGDEDLDAALREVLAGNNSGEPAALAARASDEVLIAMFQGNALVPGKPFHDDELVEQLTPAQKRLRNKAYWAAESAKNARECVFVWFANRLASTPAGRAHLLEVVAGDHHGRVRGLVAHALREVADDALWRELATRLDPLDFHGKVDHTSSTYLLQTYTVGATAGLIVDPDAAYARWKPLLDPEAVTRSKQAELQAGAVVLGIKGYIGEPPNVRDGAPLARFTPDVSALLAVDELQHFAMFALERLPSDPRACDVIAKRFPPGTTYYGDHELKLLSHTTDPAHLPVLAAALGNNWRHWRSAFTGLANIGDPRGIAVIETWIAANDASDRTQPAKDAIAAIRAKAGEPTPEQRAEGIALLGAGEKKKKQKR
jgi:hypothetical protein